MSNEFGALERNAVERIISLFPPKDAQAAVDRIKLLQGKDGLAIALTIAGFDPQVSGVRFRQGFNKDEFRLQLIGRLGLAAGELKLCDPVLGEHLAAEFDLDA